MLAAHNPVIANQLLGMFSLATNPYVFGNEPCSPIDIVESAKIRKRIYRGRCDYCIMMGREEYEYKMEVFSIMKTVAMARCALVSNPYLQRDKPFRPIREPVKYALKLPRPML